MNKILQILALAGVATLAACEAKPVETTTVTDLPAIEPTTAPMADTATLPADTTQVLLDATNSTTTTTIPLQ